MEKSEINSFKQRLHEGPIHFTFIKKNGEERKAYGTMKEDLLPKRPEPSSTDTNKRKMPEGNILYFDLDKSGFRSFNESQLISVDL